MKYLKCLFIITIFLFYLGCTVKAKYTNGTVTHTIESENNTVVTYEDGKVKMIADFRPRRTWSLLFPALLNKANDITLEAGD